MHPLAHGVEVAGKPVSLTRTEYAILKLLLAHPGQVIAKPVILDRISADTLDCTESSLKTHISHLRSKLREAGGKARVSAGDWVQVFGRDGRWALIQYRVSGSHLRFGYVYRDAFEDFDSIPELRLEHAPLRQDNEFVTSDPLGACGRVELTGGVYEMTRLAMLGDRWMYVELTLPNGKPARMFAETEPSHG